MFNLMEHPVLHHLFFFTNSHGFEGSPLHVIYNDVHVKGSGMSSMTIQTELVVFFLTGRYPVNLGKELESPRTAKIIPVLGTK